MNVGNVLQTWYGKNRRDLPWRNTGNAYHIWVSEIILQQTRVSQGISYYHRFLKKFPRLEDLARARPDEVMHVWKGLGYYSRARNMHVTAIRILNEYEGKFPSGYENILRLRGIGPYTAAAIASFAFNEPVPVVDGNVYRFLARLFGIVHPVGTAAGKKAVTEKAGKVMNRKNPALHNQAIMEFGALQCTPFRPPCHACPFRKDCLAYITGRVNDLPVKQKKPASEERYFNYVLLTGQLDMLLKKREKQDIWKGLYEFPLFESTSQIEPGQLTGNEWWKRLEKRTGPLHLKYHSGIITHILSHRKIRAVFYHAETRDSLPALQPGETTVSVTNWESIAFPVLIDKFLSQYLPLFLNGSI
ncbi:MAG TPA: A/G-specific adenine glycosylase [Bacteroidetes bacterium]|nr:A/G-specific adenine glycosylase [Bacteroidota bacterium]